MGWQVTATDITESSLNLAKQRARQEEVSVDFRVCDMRDLHQTFPSSFDWFDNIMEDKPHYELKEERLVPHGRVIRLEDWNYESQTHVVCIYAFLREDNRKQGYRWTTDIFSVRRRALRKAELKRFLIAAGFGQIGFLPQSTPWTPYEVVASS